MKKRVMCVFGTRPEAVKLAPVVHALKASKKVEPIVVLTAQHREMLDQMMKWFEIEPQYDLNLMQHGQTLPELTSKVMLGVDKLLTEAKPDMLLVQGDTVTVMAAALSAFYQKIPVGHVEAGLRTGDRYNPFPEEMARQQVGRLATLHFAPTQRAVDNLSREGITEHVYLTGNTVIDALKNTVSRLNGNLVDKKLFANADFENKRVLLVTAHRRENWGSGMEEIAHALRQIADEHQDVQVLYAIHKNPVVRDSFKPIFKDHPRLILIEPLDYLPFVYALQKCFFVLTDSGGIQEEAPTFGKPVLVMRTNTERPEAVQAGSSKLVGVTREGIFEAANTLLKDANAYKTMSTVVNPFGDGKASERIVEAIENYLV